MEVDGGQLFGWDELEGFVKVGKETITKWIKLYGFPSSRRRKTTMHDRRACQVWLKTEVQAWMNLNQTLISGVGRKSPGDLPRGARLMLFGEG